MYKVIVLLFCGIGCLAQDKYMVRKLSTAIQLDGKLEEEAWNSLQPLEDFWQYFPSDTSKAIYNTKVFLAYDDRNLYVGAIMDSKGDHYVVPTLKRDFRGGGNDNISFVFDTFQDHTNGFLFGINPLGVQREALLYNGATNNNFFNPSWDNKWYSESSIGERFWSCELAIPWSTLRFKQNSQEWLFKAYRFDSQSNENSVTVKVPQNQIIMTLGYETPIVFEEPLHSTGKNISVIPYVSAGRSKDFENKADAKNTFGIGADAKIAITSGLNLDLTVNPDFSTVEVDQQVVNLTRFDITFPEQRQFFIENSDLFTGFGSYSTNPYVPPSGWHCQKWESNRQSVF